MSIHLYTSNKGRPVGTTCAVYTLLLQREPHHPVRKPQTPTPGAIAVIKYLGSKRTLLPFICEAIGALDGTRSVIDLFSGTSRVGHALKGEGYQVFSNDINAYATTLARCYVESDRDDVHARVSEHIRTLNALPGKRGYFTRTFCESSRFFQPKNGARVDAIRDWIETQNLESDVRAVLLVSLMEAADRVDSTTGVQMAYLKQWAKRSHNDLQLRVPDVLPRAKHGKGRATQLDALEAARQLSADIAYLDPPYNQHKYVGNYHIWETLVRWDAPEAYGVACKRVDVRARKSPYNSKRAIHQAMSELVGAVDAGALVVSYSDEGYIPRDDMVQLLSSRGDVFVREIGYPRYVGARIGVHNPKGERVGKTSHLRNTEYLFVVPTKSDVVFRDPSWRPATADTPA